MNAATALTWCCLLAAGLLLPGCMVGPDYVRPETAAQADSVYFNAGKNNQDPNVLPTIDNWWETFADETTTALVRKALENNLDLQAAAARLIQAHAALSETAGLLWPDISYELNRDRSKRSFNFGGLGGGGRFSVMTTTWAQQISVSYVLDFFGRLRRLKRAAWAEMLAAEANQDALTNSIIAAVITARVQIAALQRRLDIERANSESRRKTLDIVERRYAQGLVGPVDVRLARENLAAAQSVIPTIELSLATARHALDVILARRPGSSDHLPQTLPDLPNLKPITIGLPVSLLDRRPDIRAAEMALKAANERIGVSVAQFFPDLTLTAGWGRSADTWEDLWIDETEVYSALMRLGQPIFKGGQLRARHKAAKARYSEAAAIYSATVLNALKEVEDALVAEDLFQRQLRYVEIRLSEALAAEQLSRERYLRGVEKVLTVLESERRRRIAENELILLKQLMWTNRVNLHLALGGDWCSQLQNDQ
ncbi:MAG TPA: efflux transporter outer membrane subunit [Sedimentisphaerales bacterium]|nr:efflux transporter outer membrane subunit [Sedimentisphaerales bacterium]